MEDMAGGSMEGVEMDYFESLVKEEGILEKSCSSGQGSATFPTFGLDQTTSGLQGSQGSVTANVQGMQISVEPGTVQCISGQDNVFLLMNTDSENSGLVTPFQEDEGEEGDGGRDTEMKDCGKTGSQDKSLKCKASPKRRVRRSRTSSNSDCQTPKQDGSRQSLSPHRGEPADGPNSSDLSFKPPLLDEILTDKKLALMRSPEVIRFLQAQQAKLAQEKQLTCRPIDDS